MCLKTNSTHAEWETPTYIDSTGATLDDECKGGMSSNLIFYLIVKPVSPT